MKQADWPMNDNKISASGAVRSDRRLILTSKKSSEGNVNCPEKRLRKTQSDR